MDAATLEEYTVREEPAAAAALTIDHIAIAVADLEEAIRWYSQGLGFRLIERRTTRGRHTGMISAVLSTPGATIVLIQGTEPESQVCRFIERFGPGVQHIAFSVADMDAAMANIRAAGAGPDIPTIAGPGIRQVFLRRDPASGVRVELVERSGGSFSDDSVARLFGEFESRDLV